MRLPRLRYSMVQLLLLTVVVAVAAMVWSRHLDWQNAEVRYIKLIASSDGSPETQQLVMRLVRRYPQLVEKPGSMEWVILFGNLDTCRFFLEHGANPNETGQFLGEPPLHFAIVTDNPELAHLLLEFGVDINARRQTPSQGEQGDSFLHTAARQGKGELCQILLDEQIAVEATNQAGQTPLHLAVQWAPASVVQLLLERGARCQPDDSGRTPRDIVEARREEYEMLNLRPSKINAIARLLDQYDTPAEPVGAFQP